MTDAASKNPTNRTKQTCAVIKVLSALPGVTDALQHLPNSAAALSWSSAFGKAEGHFGTVLSGQQFAARERSRCFSILSAAETGVTFASQGKQKVIPESSANLKHSLALLPFDTIF